MGWIRAGLAASWIVAIDGSPQNAQEGGSGCHQLDGEVRDHGSPWRNDGALTKEIGRGEAAPGWLQGGVRPEGDL